MPRCSYNVRLESGTIKTIQDISYFTGSSQGKIIEYSISLLKKNSKKINYVMRNENNKKTINVYGVTINPSVVDEIKNLATENEATQGDVLTSAIEILKNKIIKEYGKSIPQKPKQKENFVLA